jgi:hypothetical protein
LNLAFESQCFLLTLKEANIPIHEDLKIGLDMITFAVLWLHGQLKDASAYLDSAARTVNTIIKGTPTKLNKIDIQNLYGLIVCSLAALSVHMGGEQAKAVELCTKCLTEFSDSEKISEYIRHIISSLSLLSPSSSAISFAPAPKDFSSRSYKFPPMPEDALDNPLPADSDWLITKAFQNLLLESSFYPIISPNTPALKKEELEFEQAKTKLLEVIESSFQNQDEEKRQSSSVPRRLQSRASPKRTTASVLKNRPSMHWWQNNQFMDKVLQKTVMQRNDASIGRMRKKNRETQNLPPVEPQIKEIYAARVSPRRSVLRKRENRGKREGQTVMDIEPGDEKHNHGLQPIGPTRKH